MKKMALGLCWLFAGCGVEQGTFSPESFGEALLRVDSIPAPADSIGDASAFGSVDAVVPLDRARLAVVDGRNGIVRLLRNGMEVHQVGGSGDGPREFGRIRRAIGVGGDSLLVLDQGRSRIVMLHAVEDSLAFARESSIPFVAGDLCMADRVLYLAGSHGGSILHRATLGGEVEASFGELEGENPVIQALSGRGRLACSDEADDIAFATLTLGIVRVFSKQGAEIRRDSIPGFVRTIYETSAGGFGPRLPEEGYAHSVAELRWFDADLFVQLSRGAQSEGVGRESLLWSALDQSWTRLPPWPTILAVRPDGTVLASVEDPYPRILRYRVE